MARWLLGGTAGLLIVCIACVWLGYSRVRPHLHNRINTAMATSLTDSVSARIEHGGLSGDLLQLRERDLDVNTEERFGEWGWEVSTDGTAVYGVQTRILDDGLVLGFPGFEISGQPVVEQGRIELRTSASQSARTSLLLSERDVEQVIERGVNNALASYGLAAVAIDLAPGTMTIRVRRLDGQPLPTAVMVSATAVTSATWVE